MTVLLIDVYAAGSRVGLAAGGKISWRRSAVPRGAAGLLAKTLARPKKISAVLALVRESGQTFSNARAAVSLANALAFAWRAPIGELRISGEETEAELALVAARTGKTAGLGSWIKPRYNAEPNITAPK